MPVPNCLYRRLLPYLLAAGALSVALISAAHAGSVPQLIPRLTGPDCAARGGTIQTWTNTAGQGPDVGECYIPPKLDPGRSGYVAPAAPRNNNTAAALGFLSAVQNLLEAVQDLNAPSADNQAGPQQQESPGRDGADDDRFVYYCPPEGNVYDLTRPGRYVRPGEGCGGKRAQRLPRPEGPKGDEKYAYFCPPEDNVYDMTRPGRYVRPGEGCGGGAGPKLSDNVVAGRRRWLETLRTRIANLPDGPQKQALEAKTRALERSLAESQ